MSCERAGRIGARRRWAMRTAASMAGVIVVVTGSACASAPSKSDRPPTIADPLPVGEDSAPPPAGTFYEVKPGDTLYGIASRHQVSVEEIAEVNGLEHADQLAVGQVLFIPDDGLALPSASPAPVVDDEAPPDTAVATRGLLWPLDEGIIVRDFDRGRAQDGMVMAAPKGTVVMASADGEVVFVGDEGKTYGRMVMIRHANSILTIYAHLDRIDVEKGAKVRARDAIGTVGDSGRTESPQLHFQVRRGRDPENPLSHLPSPE